jgi:hypothetical protein
MLMVNVDRPTAQASHKVTLKTSLKPAIGVGLFTMFKMAKMAPQGLIGYVPYHTFASATG